MSYVSCFPIFGIYENERHCVILCYYCLWTNKLGSRILISNFCSWNEETRPIELPARRKFQMLSLASLRWLRATTANSFVSQSKDRVFANFLTFLSICMIGLICRGRLHLFKALYLINAFLQGDQLFQIFRVFIFAFIHLIDSPGKDYNEWEYGSM